MSSTMPSSTSMESNKLTLSCGHCKTVDSAAHMSITSHVWCALSSQTGIHTVKLIDLDIFDNLYGCIKIRPNILSHGDDICCSQLISQCRLKLCLAHVKIKWNKTKAVPLEGCSCKLLLSAINNKLQSWTVNKILQWFSFSNRCGIKETWIHWSPKASPVSTMSKGGNSTVL